MTRHPYSRLRIIICVTTLATTTLTLRADLATVTTDAGTVSGAPPSGGVTAYLGIPYAAPPVGDLRWRPPQPVVRWDGVRKADHFGTSCMTAASPVSPPINRSSLVGGGSPSIKRSAVIRGSPRWSFCDICLK